MADTDKNEYWGRNAYGGYGDARDPNKPSGMQDETARYAQKAQDAGGRQAYQANYDQYGQYMGASNDARGTQNNALGLIAARAQGQGPSAAEIAGKNAQDQALASTVAAAGTARGGPMQQAAVMRGSLGGLATQSQGLTNQIQAGRAAEIANAQDAYMQGAGAIRSGDFQGAGLGLQKTAQDIQNEQYQRGLNQNDQQFYEQQRQKVFEDQLAANQAAQQESDQAAAQNRQNTLKTEEDAWGKVKDVAGTVAGAAGGVLGGILKSDERAKLQISPIGSLSGMAQTGVSGDSPTGSMSVKNGGMDVMDSLAKTNAIDTQYVKNPGGGMMMSDEHTKVSVMGSDGVVSGAGAERSSAAGNRDKPDLGYVRVRRDSAEQTEANSRAAYDKGSADTRRGNAEYDYKVDREDARPRVRPVVTSDERAKTGAKKMTDAEANRQIAATQKQAGDEVAAKRKAGGYAELDMTPIPASYGDKGYQGADAEKATAKLHGAIERETEGADPYQQSTRGDFLGLDNAQEAARIRAEHAGGPSAPHGIGDAAQAQYDKEHGVDPTRQRWGNVLTGMSQRFLAGSLGGVATPYGASTSGGVVQSAGIHPGRDVTYSDDRTKLAAAWSEGNQAAQEETRRLLAMPPDQLKKDPHGIARDILVAKGDSYDEGRDVYAPAADQHARTIARSKAHLSQSQGLPPGMTESGGITMAPPGEAERQPKSDRVRTEEPAPQPAHQDMAVVPRPSPLDVIKARVKSYGHKAAGATTAALDKLEDTTTDALGSLYPEGPDPMAAMRATEPTTTSDKRAKEVLHAEEPMREANRSMEPSEYRYKPEYTPPGQKPGEVNVGPIAQNMAADPVAATAIVKTPDGLLAIDKEKGLKLAMGSLASLQRQIDALARRKEA